MPFLGERLNDDALARIRFRKPPTFTRDEAQRQCIATQRAGGDPIVVGENPLRQRAIAGDTGSLR